MKKKFSVYLTLILILITISKISAQSPKWIWGHAFGATNDDTGYNIATDPSGSGDIYVIGHFQGSFDMDPGPGTFMVNSSGGNDVFICKFDKLGKFIWGKTIGGSGNAFGYYVLIDPSINGDIYITGFYSGIAEFESISGTYTTTSNGGFDIFISKLSKAGSFLWTKTVGGPGDDLNRYITIDTFGTGSIYTTGSFSNTVDFDPSDEEYYLTANGSQDIAINKFDLNGNFIWAKSIGGIGLDRGQSIVFDPSGIGCLYVAGNFMETTDFDPGAGTFELSSLGEQDVFILKLDSAGQFLWAKSFGGESPDRNFSLVLDPYAKGQIYATGFFGNTVDFDPGPQELNLSSNGLEDIYLIKLNNEGNLLWAKSFGGSGTDWGSSITISSESKPSIYITGLYENTVDFDPSFSTEYNLTSEGGRDIFISKFDALGNYIWTKSLGGTTNDWGLSLATDVANNLYLTGNFTSPTVVIDNIILTNANPGGSRQDIVILKLNDSGSSIIRNDHFNSFNAFPIPSNNYLTIDCNDDNFDNAEISFINTFGQTVYIVKERLSSDQQLIDISDLPEGVYFIILQTNQNYLIKKIVKESNK